MNFDSYSIEDIQIKIKEMIKSTKISPPKRYLPYQI